MKKRIIKLTIISLLLIIGIIILVVTISKNKKSYVARDPYDKSKFVMFEDTPKDKIFELSNNRFEFRLNSANTQFEVKDKTTNQQWLSSPEKLNEQTATELSELFVVYYERQLETPKSVSVLDESIKFNKYGFRFENNSLDVLYEIGGKREISFTDLPRKVPVEKFEELILKPLEELGKEDSDVRRNISFLKSRFMLLKEENVYFLRDITAQDALDIIYDLIFVKSDYTEDDYIEDNTKYGFPIHEDIPYFEFVVKYLLTDKGLKVQIINDSIYETEKFQIAYIDVLPYFGVGNINDYGFTVIPDGSGIFIDHENGRYNTTTYEKRIYGTDLSVESGLMVQPEEQEVIKLPMYAYSKNDYGFINVVESSDSMTSIRAAFRTTTRNNVYTNKIPYVHYRYLIRERDAFNFASSSSTQRVSIWTSEYNKEDFMSEYIFVEDGKEYYNFASEYQEYLKANFNFKNKTNEDILHLTFLGGYKEKKYFLGFSYETVNALTKASKIMEIADKINSNNDLSISYQGWSNDGIKATSMKNISFNNKVASKKQIKNLLKDANSKNIDLYLEFNANTAYTDKKISVNKDVNKTLLQNTVAYNKYNLATTLADRSTMNKYYLNTNYSTKVYDQILKFSNKNELSNIVISDDGSRLSSNFTNKKVIFRNELIDTFDTNINKLDSKNIALRDSNFYGIIKANKILDVKTIGTRHRMVDYSIPFMQLVLNGLVDYYSASINLDTSKSIKWHQLKAIETGSKMQFTLSYEDTVNLINTEYSNYYSTFYNNWIETINSTYNYLKNTGIYESRIVGHKVLNADATIVEVEYENGSKYVINYLNETVIESEVK
ncbi:DUF5696 domain-containing protein [Haploplasma axanthum]|uniref:Uncharacterized protein n=1 Tax=Haploplasma axanthum TaxID=29552 RepID=A0A449BBF8_HAPAX|nr:DUF5696 domain-containing protein [Haploplasma axanthum]VEU79773.1 Uncharacterised protein [Haploplasma axanthum]